MKFRAPSSRCMLQTQQIQQQLMMSIYYYIYDDVCGVVQLIIDDDVHG
jgi:hypothetical protein